MVNFECIRPTIELWLLKRNLNTCMLRKKEKGAFHELNCAKVFPSYAVFSMPKRLSLSLTLFWLAFCWTLNSWGGWVVKNSFSSSNRSWGKLLGNCLKLLDYKLIHMIKIIKIQPKNFMITSLFCLRQHFPWWHHLFLFKILATTISTVPTEPFIVSESITSRLKVIE